MKKIKKLIAFINAAFADETAAKIMLQTLSTSKPEVSQW